MDPQREDERPAADLTVLHVLLQGSLRCVRRRVDLGPTHVAGAVQDLTLEFGGVYLIVVDQAQRANAGRRAATARKLGITRECRYKKMKRSGIE